MKEEGFSVSTGAPLSSVLESAGREHAPTRGHRPGSGRAPVACPQQMSPTWPAGQPDREDSSSCWVGNAENMLVQGLNVLSNSCSINENFFEMSRG